jgi:hypothetical protein
MPRTVVPPQPAAAGGAAGGAEDGLPEKLVKYVPAETLAFFVPVCAAVGTGHKGWLIAIIVVAAIGTLAYLWQAAPSVGSLRVVPTGVAHLASILWAR